LTFTFLEGILFQDHEALARNCKLMLLSLFFVDAVLVLPLSMVDNSISLCKHISGWFFRHGAVRIGHLILE
jgi:hypothetical protein